MRNLKRALSLTLASVMLLGMMVVGSSAAGYSDVDDNDNVEAIEVLQAIEVMVGDAGSTDFRPDEPVRRAEMAVVMGKLLNLNYNYYSSTCPFSDVSGSYDWAKGWVGAAYANKILSGRSADVFDPGAYVTAIEAASMMMRALGYFKYAEDIADGFQLATVRQGNQIGIFDGVGTDANTPLTRNQVAQMALNALRSEIVDFTGTPGIEVNGVKVGYRAQYDPRTGTEAKYNAIAGLTTTLGKDESRYYVQLGEELYNGKLRLTNDIDDFGRPSRVWEYDGKAIGTYAKTELLRKEYIEDVTGADMYNLLGNSIVTGNNAYDLVVYVDGWQYDGSGSSTYNKFDKINFTRNNKTTLQHTGRGVQTEVYVDTQAKEVTVAIVNTYLAKANADYNNKTEKVSVSVYYGIDRNGTPNDPSDDENVSTSKTLELADFPQISGVKEGDFMLVNWADKEAAAGKKVVAKVMDVDVLSDRTVTKFSQSGNLVTKVTTDGTEYKGAAQLFYDVGTLNVYDNTLLTSKTYDIYLDQFGNAIGVDLHSGDDNYVFITGFNMNASSISITNATANAIFLDGTMANIDVNVKDTKDNIEAYNANTTHAYEIWTDGYNVPNKSQVNTWYKYSLDETSKVYTLTPVSEDHQFVTADAAAVDINSKSIRLDGDNKKTNTNVTGLRGFGNEKSVYITVDTDTIDGNANTITEVTGVYTNVQTVDITSKNIANEPTVYALTDGKEFVIGAIVIGEDNGSNANYTYIFTGAKSESKVGDTYYWDVDAVVEGEIKELTIKTKYSSVINLIRTTLANTGNAQDKTFAHGYLFRLSYDADGYVVNAKKYGDTATGGATDKFIFDDWDHPIDDEIVRWNNIATPDGEELVVKDISLYNKDQITTDVGLPLAPDAKFVVAQYEYGKFEKTEYATINEALDAIADADDTTEAEKDFKGTICALLDGQGRAKWIVFDNNVGLNSDQNDDSNGDGLPQNRENLKVDKDDMYTIEHEAQGANPDAFDGIGPFLQEGLNYSYNDVTKVLTISGKITNANDKTNTDTIPGFGGSPSTLLPGVTKSKYMTIIPIPVGDDWVLMAVGSMTKNNKKITANYNGIGNEEFTISWDLDWSNYGASNTELTDPDAP